VGANAERTGHVRRDEVLFNANRYGSKNIIYMHLAVFVINKIFDPFVARTTVAYQHSAEDLLELIISSRVI
jgi:hypothetical protein